MICYDCKEDKPEEEFPWRNKSKGRRHTKCLECGREYRKQWYKENKEHHIAGVQRSKKKRIEKNKEWVRGYLLEHPCPCGESDIMYLDFHHTGMKDGNVSALIHNQSLQVVKDEVSKCQVLCVKCHRDKHPIPWRS